MRIIQGIFIVGIGFGLGSLAWLLWRKYKGLTSKLVELEAKVAPVAAAVGAVIATAAPAHALVPRDPVPDHAPLDPFWLLGLLKPARARAEAPVADVKPGHEAEHSPKPAVAVETQAQLPAVAPEPMPAPTPIFVADVPRLCDVPCPGNFYVVQDGDDLDTIATAALHIAAMLAGCEKGWAERKVRSRASAFAEDPKHQEAYIRLMNRSLWNTHVGDLPPTGAQLWLPPLRLSAIFDRSLRSRVALTTQRWPDGSDRLEPPASMTG